MERGVRVKSDVGDESSTESLRSVSLTAGNGYCLTEENIGRVFRIVTEKFNDVDKFRRQVVGSAALEVVRVSTERNES